MNSEHAGAELNLPALCPPPPPDFPNALVKAQPEDFVVEEVPLYEPSGSGTHTYLWIEKRGINTHDAARRLAAAAKKRALDAGIAGLKDAQAVARQWISFEHVKDGLDALRSFDKPELRVLKISQHGNKLKMGHLRGNRFIIRLRLENAMPDQLLRVENRSREVLETLQRRGAPNYYGPQRFGWGGRNPVLGRLLVRGEVEAFEQEFALTHGRRPPDRKLRNLMVNAFQSELFNRVAARRMPEIGRLQSGDLACIHRNGAVFAINNETEATREQPRADVFEISPSGPLFGPKMLLPDGRPGEIERAVLSEAGVTCEDFGRKEAEQQPGARRPLRMILLEAPSVEADSAGVVLKFALPSGCYASVILREITGNWKSGAE